jgi:hypothetical protein
MKPASEWDLAYILGLPEGEFDWVEFKSRPSLDFSAPGFLAGKFEDELAKQLSAFANSGGGVLVYGIKNPVNNQPKSVDDGGISIACKKPNIREWLEDVIPNMVEFPLKKFNVYVLTKASGAPDLADDRCVILIDIPDSEDAPHQSARDHLYYARIGGKSRPLGHRLITDIANRRKHPILEVQFLFRSETFVPAPNMGLQRGPVRVVHLHIQADNDGKVYAKHVHIRLSIPPSILRPRDLNLEEVCKESDGQLYWHTRLDNRRWEVIGHDPWIGDRYGHPYLDPILPSESRPWSFKCKRSLRPESMPDEKLIYEVNADNAKTIRKEILLKSIPFAVTDVHPPGKADESD